MVGTKLKCIICAYLTIALVVIAMESKSHMHHSLSHIQGWGLRWEGIKKPYHQVYVPKLFGDDGAKLDKACNVDHIMQISAVMW